jgi:hypothetical protein
LLVNLGLDLFTPSTYLLLSSLHKVALRAHERDTCSRELLLYSSQPIHYELVEAVDSVNVKIDGKRVQCLLTHVKVMRHLILALPRTVIKLALYFQVAIALHSFVVCTVSLGSKKVRQRDHQFANLDTDRALAHVL